MTGENDGKAIDYSSLKLYAFILRFARALGRIGKVVSRLAIVAIIWALFMLAMNIASAPITPDKPVATDGSKPSVTRSVTPDGKTETYSYSCTGNECPAELWLLALAIPTVVFMVNMVFVSIIVTALIVVFSQIPWRRFAASNNFLVGNGDDLSGLNVARVPSFPGKVLSLYSPLMYGEVENMRFGLTTRTYKEGGVLRWRERKMDTIMVVDLPTSLPHIVVNARANEKARRSNLAVRYGDDMRFQFEGVDGQHYDAYAAKTDQVTALQVFTPDVLSVLYTKLPTTDIEIQGKTMWFVQRYTILDDKTARQIFEGALELYIEITAQLRVVSSEAKS